MDQFYIFAVDSSKVRQAANPRFSPGREAGVRKYPEILRRKYFNGIREQFRKTT